jgi:hypothetical protein
VTESSGAGAAILETGDDRLSGHAGRRRKLLEMVGILEPVFHDQLDVVPLVEDLAADVWIELTQKTDLAVLLRDQLLAHRRDLDEQVLFGQVEVGREELARIAVAVPGNRERAGLVLPRDPVEVQE